MGFASNQLFTECFIYFVYFSPIINMCVNFGFMVVFKLLSMVVPFNKLFSLRCTETHFLLNNIFTLIFR